MHKAIRNQFTSKTGELPGKRAGNESCSLSLPALNSKVTADYLWLYEDIRCTE